MVNPPAISFHDLTLGYGKHAVLRHLEASVPRGALLAVVGANGTGKSTLLKALMGELKPMSGSIHLQGFGWRDLAYLPQRVALEQNFPMDVHDCVAMGLWRQVGVFGGVSPAQEHKITDALATVGMGGMQHSTLSRLSGGQMQRVLFARLLLQDAPVILLDEPFNAIDTNTTLDLLKLIQHWHQQGRTVLTVLHDWGLVRQYFPATLWLTDGQAVYGNTAKVLGQQSERWVA
ncbi:MAG TPA: ABC transporter ATP-binding protein [Candidatus Thiothrix moscowensis]|uniref:metal ABC transporter ATP-binding protein n=1 Tax=unclassified Thiothrix TaxID=2636184 RepID=UPI0025DDF3FE|nr:MULTISPECIES: ABC transporter ATP-binding protein [unclassified Thiothrix]HRJ52541.1 ABC transporter ATP-binding protein [Candidatus Thiothrix moscowensis]HRJ94315.1 ABC transporter ATP-binding protein [Candidatus Thiothrix moscowensis]